MITKSHLLLLLAIPLPVVFTSQSAIAFNLKYSGSDYLRTSYYRTDSGNDGFALTNFIEKLPAPNENSEFWSVLTSSFDAGWSFRSEHSIPLYGTFDIKSYHICSPSKACGAIPTPQHIVGAQLDLDYVPNLELGDPDPTTGRVRWIQWVKSNHSVNPDIHGNPESVIDEDIDNLIPRTPYYYSGLNEDNSRLPYDFFDLSRRADPDFNHDWTAQLYLAVEEPLTLSDVARRVTIYGGIEWGWSNRVARTRDPDPMCVPDLSYNFGGQCSPDSPPSNPPVGNCAYSGEPFEPCPPDGGFSLSAARNLAFVNSNPSSETTSVPEPGSALAVLAVGIYGGISWRKQKAMK